MYIRGFSFVGSAVRTIVARILPKWSARRTLQFTDVYFRVVLEAHISLSLMRIK